MTATAVAVAANFKDAPKFVGLFGLNTTYPSNFLNWFLFIVCFGFIWMWFF